MPLIQLIAEHREELFSEWDLTFDYVYTSLDDVMVAAARHGEMHIWQLDDTGEPYTQPWTAREPFDTAIDGVFRIFRAGEDLANLYFVDETGAIYIGFGEDHRRIGMIDDYHSADETVLTIIFEDQMTEKIGFLHATEAGVITPLTIQWEEPGFEADFLTELDSPQTGAAIARLAEVVRQDAEEAAGE